MVRNVNKEMRALGQFDPISVRIPDAVRMTGLSRSKIYLLIAAGDLEAAKVGRSTVVSVESLKAVGYPRMDGTLDNRKACYQIIRPVADCMMQPTVPEQVSHRKVADHSFDTLPLARSIA